MKILLFSLWLHFVRGKLKEKLQMNHHHLRSGAWQTECFVILDSFLPFYLPNNLESSKFWKREKSIWRCHHFTHVYQKWKPWCMIPEIWRATEEFFLIFGPFFAFLLPLTTWKIKILKNEKKPGNIIVLHRCTINENHMMYGS